MENILFSQLLLFVVVLGFIGLLFIIQNRLIKSGKLKPVEYSKSKRLGVAISVAGPFLVAGIVMASARIDMMAIAFIFLAISCGLSTYRRKVWFDW